ncbi:MAG TPA: PIN domain-containing protein [Verrucomicrobiae bacterium]|nr:PIN domain-containing protein [Verrucomicrobiae bacterium]
MTLFLDTNVVIAACVEEHEHHTRALPLLQSVHTGVNDGCVSGHGILEVYAILTRLPRAPRILPGQAAALVEENILKHFATITLTAKEYGELTSKLGRNGVLGGQAYDVLHLECAEKSDADRIYTFNVRHFASLAPHLTGRIAAP